MSVSYQFISHSIFLPKKIVLSNPWWTGYLGGRSRAISWCSFEVWLQDSTPFPAQLMKQRNFKGRSAIIPASGGEWFPSVSFREKNEEFILSYLPRFDVHQMIYPFLVMTIYLVAANKKSVSLIYNFYVH